MFWKKAPAQPLEERDELLRQYIAFRLREVPFALVIDSPDSAAQATRLYPLAGAATLLVHGDALGALPKDIRARAKAFRELGELLDLIAKAGVRHVVYCATAFDSAGIDYLLNLRGAVPGARVFGHSDFLFLFDYLYNTIQKTQLYQIKAADLLSSYFKFERSRERVVSNEKIKGLRHASIEGKKAIELGCLHCGMTNFFLMDSPRELISVEIDFQNIALFNAWKTACGHDNASILVQDFHGLTEHCDVLLTYGVLYHTAQPLRLVEHLSTLADTLLIGTHVWSAKEELPRLQLPWRGRDFEVMVTPEYKESTGGLCVHQTYVKREDYFAVLDTLGFDCSEIETTERPNGRVYAEFIARRR